MTFFDLLLRPRDRRPSPRNAARTPMLLAEDDRPSPASIGVVVPVRDNPAGVERLAAWFMGLPSLKRPCEMIVVDDGSRAPVGCSSPIRVLRIASRGPAAARNAGWRASSSRWIAFVDSDCLPDEGWPGAFADGWSGEIAAQGRVRSLGHDVFSRYYDTQGVLRPMHSSLDGRPSYLITANALVHRRALEIVGGFRESFRLAAGEDVDLGLRLAEVGLLRWSEEAAVAHDFENSAMAFVRRFVRYGRGNRALANELRHDAIDGFVPRPFSSRSTRASDKLLARLAYLSLLAGWSYEGWFGLVPREK